MKNEGSAIRLKAEEFRNSVGDVVGRRASGSIGADAVLTEGGTVTRVFDLKTHSGKRGTKINKKRQNQFENRFGTKAEEIFRKQQ